MLRLLLSPRLALLVLGTLICTAVVTALSSANVVPASRASDTQNPITANNLKPSECAGLNVTAKIAGSGTLTGTAAAELIVGGPGADTISGGGRGDCVL